MFGYIYKYENIINGKVYIGQTVDLTSRMSSHKNKSTYVRNKFYNAVRKYGWANFNYSVIAKVESDSLESVTDLLDKLEIEYISQYDSYYHGYNSTLGGHSKRGYKLSDEFSKMCKRRTYSNETRRKMSIAAHNRKVSDSTREKCRQNALKRNFAQFRELTTDKRNAAIRKSKAKPVNQLDTNGNLINTFETVRDAAHFVWSNLAKDLKYDSIENAIINHCKGKSKNIIYYGFIWQYKTSN